MKRFILLNALALSCSVALAAPHGYQLQVGSSELDPSIWDGPEPTWKTVEPRSFKDSRTAWYESADVDGNMPLRFVGAIVPSGPTRISLYEAYRGSPEGTAYRDYFDRFPTGSSEPAIAEKQQSRDGDV